MKRMMAAALFVGGVMVSLPARGEQPVAMNVPAPELEKADDWINSKPLQLKDLRRQVVVVHFWTFG